MKTIGFLKIHDESYKGSKDLKTMISTPRAYYNLDKIIEYLESGHYFADPLVFLDDDEGLPLPDIGYQTDGEWIWPNYFPYYLKKYPNYEIDKEFLNYLNKKNFIYVAPDKSQTIKASDYFSRNIW
ncbi:hypothetical protein [Apibacter sp. HY039]|uniref:hypothetical protein n=1 Tax=Apibacter sp. HY039 TaxID=2501476 RepID=UPI000FEBE071|nr:hypothetical protein [Apibacter sp. HY039]